MGLKQNPDGTYDVPIRERKKASAEQVQLRVVFGILICTLLLLVFGLLLVILPTFRIKNIVVKGNKVASKEEIIDAMELHYGDETFAFSKKQAIKNLYANPKCRTVRSVQISRSPSTVTITVEDDVVLVAAAGQGQCSFDRDLRARGYSTEENAFPNSIPVKLPQIYGTLTIGEPIPFADSEIDKSYILALFDALEEAGEWYRVSAIDASRKFYLSFDRDERVRIVLGTVDNFEKKLALADQILTDYAEDAPECVIVDVSNPNQYTWTPVSQEKFLPAQSESDG